MLYEMLPSFTAPGRDFSHCPSAAPAPTPTPALPDKVRRPYRALLQRAPQALQVGLRAPDFSDEALVCHVEAAHVQNVVNGFHFLHLDDTGVDRFGGFTQHLPQIVLRFVKHLGKDRGGL